MYDRLRKHLKNSSLHCNLNAKSVEEIMANLEDYEVEEKTCSAKDAEQWNEWWTKNRKGTKDNWKDKKAWGQKEKAVVVQWIASARRERVVL